MLRVQKYPTAYYLKKTSKQEPPGKYRPHFLGLFFDTFFATKCTFFNECVQKVGLRYSAKNTREPCARLRL